MNILANRINSKTGKREILLFTPRDDVQCEPKQITLFFNLAKQFNLNLDEREDLELEGIVYADADTVRCELAQMSGAWCGAVAQMEKCFLTRSKQAQDKLILQEFLHDNSSLGGQFKRNSKGEFMHPDVQRWFTFFKKAFVLAARYQGEYKETMWFEADDFVGV